MIFIHDFYAAYLMGQICMLLFDAPLLVQSYSVCVLKLATCLDACQINNVFRGRSYHMLRASDFKLRQDLNYSTILDLVSRSFRNIYNCVCPLCVRNACLCVNGRRGMYQLPISCDERLWVQSKYII